ncbi:MAG: SBBP repeat-containing protein [Deltaproteobacteria bacterium]|nr:SBBP repeat-containing protein [Deltaproteobacteria bacterium]
MQRSILLLCVLLGACSNDSPSSADAAPDARIDSGARDGTVVDSAVVDSALDAALGDASSADHTIGDGASPDGASSDAAQADAGAPRTPFTDRLNWFASIGFLAEVRDLAAAGNLLYMVGSADNGSDLHYARSAQNGQWIGAADYGSSPPSALAAVAADSQAIYVAGFYSGQAALPGTKVTVASKGQRDGFYTKFLPSTTPTDTKEQWLRRGICAADHSFNDIAVAGATLAVVGQFSQTLETFLLTGQSGSTLVAGGSVDGLVVSAKAGDGQLSWARQLGTTGQTVSAERVAIDSQGNIIVAGRFSGSTVFETTKLTTRGGADIFVIKLDASGKQLWAQAAGGSGNDRVTGIGVDGSGNVYLAGWSDGDFKPLGGAGWTSAGGDDGWALSLDASGNLRWGQPIAGPGDERLRAMAVIGSKVYLGGSFNKQLRLGGDVLTPRGMADALLVGLDASTGNVVEAEGFGSLKDDTVSAMATTGQALFIAGQRDDQITIRGKTYGAPFGGGMFFQASFKP